MQRVLSAIVVFLLSLPVLAATKEMEGATAPVETVDMIYVVIFGIIFVGGVVGFFVYLFWTDRDKNPD